jgi:SET domain-containing protein
MNPFSADLATKVFCRIGVSKIHGVGVICIRPIAKGINPMQEKMVCEFSEVPVAEIDALNLPLAVRQLVVDMCPENDGVYDVPSQGLNSIGIAWYLNHSDTPNMEERDGEFFAILDIAEGEELTANYLTYGELNL